MKNPYGLTDKALQRIKKRMEMRFRYLSVVMPFDELNAVRARGIVEDVYQPMKKELVRDYELLCEEVFREAESEIGRENGSLELIPEVLIALLLRKYDPVTEVVFDNEWERKKDRLIEALVATDSHQGRRDVLNRTLNGMYRQVKQGADEVTDETRLDAFRKGGVKRVRWATQHDGIVCGNCAEHDGVIYEIDHVPTKHRNCRCHLEAVMEDQG